MKSYESPRLVPFGGLASLTAADFTNANQDTYILADGTPIVVPGLSGSGPGCVDGDKNGVCDYIK